MITFITLQLADGIHLEFHGIGNVFRFRLGSGKFSRLSDQQNFLFSVEGAAGHYLVQVLHREYVAQATVSPMDIISWYMRSEAEFETAHAGAKPLERDCINVFDHPSGAPIVTWLRRRSTEPSQEPTSIPATSYFVHATLLHSPSHLLDFVVTGIDSEVWTERDLTTQAARLASSYASVALPY